MQISSKQRTVRALATTNCARWVSKLVWRGGRHFETSTGRKTKESGTETQTSGSVSSNSRGISTQVKKSRKIGVEATVNSNLSFLVAEIFVFLNYSKIVLLRQENIRIMLAVLLLEKGQKLCSIPQIMPKIMLAQSARAYSQAILRLPG